VLFPLIKHLGQRFSLVEIDDDSILSILCSVGSSDYEWLLNIRDKVLDGKMSYKDAKLKILNALYLVGIVGMKTGTSKTMYSFEKGFYFSPGSFEDASFCIHKMFWSAFDFSPIASASQCVSA